MIAEIGIYSLILSFFISCFITLNPYLGCKKIIKINYNFLETLSIGQFLCLLSSLSCLLVAFLQDDFSISYVTSHSHSSLPTMYKISALWGGHEGSLLIYITCISFWTVSFLFFSKNVNEKKKSIILSITSIFICTFLIMIIFFSSPFETLYPNIPIDGNDLNPLLQDKSMIIHPPILYLGYVGFIIPFAISLTQIISKKIDKNFGFFIKPWVLFPWGLLTLGIVLGSYWAYYELGWGGFWFWDPVENASFMPWLTSLALMHSILAFNSNKTLLGNVIFLSITTFFFSLLGTFLVRSGAVFSVHSFASDSTRGNYLLLILVLFFIAIIFILYKKSYLLRTKNQYNFFSKTNVINLNNIFILCMVISILFGTLYPLISGVFEKQNMSVDVQYFNLVFKITILPIIFVMVLSPLFNWNKLVKNRLIPFLILIILNLFLSYLFCIYFLPNYNFNLIFWMFIIFSIFNSAFFDFIYSNKKSIKIGMLIGHIGFALSLFGVFFVKSFEIEKDLALKIGDTITLNDFDIRFSDLKKIKGSNFVGHKGVFEIKKNKKTVGKIYPEKRLFIVQEVGISETAIFTNFFYDIYVAITSPLNDSKTWAVRVYYKPCVRFIWFGGIFIFLSSILSFFILKKSRKLD